jgi:signal transduction histidine kinase
VYIGSSNGLLVFAPGQAGAVNPNPPEVVITGIRLFNDPIAPSEEGPLAVAAPVADEVRFEYDQNVITFEFAAVHYSDPGRNVYAYRLDDFDDDWVEVGGQRTATYTSLDPGRYTFRVRAASADGIWSEEEAIIRLVVTPPWWRTTWAYLLYVLLAGAALSATDRVQRRRVQRQERERAVRAEAELRAVMAETESRALKSEAERLKAEDERKAAELARQEAELQRARENEQKSREIARAYDALEASVRDLRATQAQLIQQEKLASLGALTAGIAHEIKNPLNFVNNFAQLSVDLADEIEAELRERGDALEESLADLVELLGDLRDNARRIHEHGRRADRIVKNMLAHSSGGGGERALTDLNRFVDEYANLAYHGMRAKESSLNIALNRDFDPAVGQVEVIPQDLGRVLINLLNNAFYAVTERARKSQPGDYTPTVGVATRREGKGDEARVAVTISDNGAGIPGDVIGRIFEPFYTTKPSGEGTGLGLSMAYEIVTQGHGGTLEVDSRPSEGSTFIVSLPAEKTGVEGV